MDGARLKHIRKALGWTATDAAKSWGRVTPQWWHDMETGRISISPAVSGYMELKYAEAQAQQKPLALTPAHLTYFRKHFSLTQAQAAQLVGVTRVTWNRWETGKSPVPAHLIHTLRAVGGQLKTQLGESK